MLMQRDTSTLWVIDMHESLIHDQHDWQRVLDSCIWLVELAKRLGVPVIASEQYPEKLGPTQTDLLTALGDAPRVSKRAFSCVAAGCFDGVPAAGRQQAILCGIQAHACVLQTALDLKARGQEVFVVADAVSARAQGDCELAIARMREAGIAIVSREMVGFEWVREAGTPEFKDFVLDFL